ncbi:MAG TPA: hypothetical protein VH083_09510 [Myxococcales bacterium]|nr:hypothetical protein [Myxococcales bacterium]
MNKLAAALAITTGAAFSFSAAADDPRCAIISGPVGEKDPALHDWLVKLSHNVARAEGVDPLALEALGANETDLRPSLGRDCELGPFQVMPRWAGIFQLESVEMLWDPRINAIAAARIYKSGLKRWKPEYARLGKNRTLVAAGWRGPLSKSAFAALLYNWGGAARAFAHAEDLRTVSIPQSTAVYAVRFNRLLRGLAADDALRARARSSRAGGKRQS